MVKVSLVGPGDIEYHYKELLGYSEEEINSEIKNISKVLKNSGASLELLPDKGISFEISKKYKEFGGKEVIGTIPESDNTFGTNHLEEYINYDVNEKPLIDKKIDSGDWFKHDMIKGLFGDCVLYLGSSLGTDTELNGGAYIYKLIQGLKKYVKTPSKKIHPEIRFGKEYDPVFFVYSPFIKSGKLPYETERYIQKTGIDLVYVNSSEELRNKLEEFGNSKKD
jgi:hypothetical protein